MSKIVSRPQSDAYDKNYERIFGSKRVGQRPTDGQVERPEICKGNRPEQPAEHDMDRGVLSDKGRGFIKSGVKE